VIIWYLVKKLHFLHGGSPTPLETVWDGGILSATSAENANPKRANKVFERRQRNNYNKGTLGGKNASP